MKNLKDKIKGFISGIVVCSLMIGTIAFAANTKIDVAFSNIRYMFDGVEKKPTDAQGFIYNGRIYVPLSFIGKSVGKDVSWDGKAKTVWVGKKEGSFKYLDSIDYARKDSSSILNKIDFAQWGNRLIDAAPKTFEITGNNYIHGIGASFWYLTDTEIEQSIDYNINGKYKTISGSIGIDDFDKDCVGYGRIRIIGDGEELYVSENLKGGDLPRNLEVDISGVLRLQIKFEISGDHPDIIFGDAKLIQ